VSELNRAARSSEPYSDGYSNEYSHVDAYAYSSGHQHSSGSDVYAEQYGYEYANEYVYVYSVEHIHAVEYANEDVHAYNRPDVHPDPDRYAWGQRADS
jgi:hypothetical protein